MSEPTHEACGGGMAALYALGALGEVDRARFELHLETCLACVREVKSLLPVTRHLPLLAMPVEPPPALRERVLREAGGRPKKPAEPALRPPPVRGGLGLTGPSAGPGEVEIAEPAVSPPPVRGQSGLGVLFWLVAILLVAGGGVGGWYVAGLHRQIAGLQASADAATTRTQILELEANLAELEAARREEIIAVATDPTVQSLALTGQPLAPEAAGRALWTESARLAFLATGLPAPPEGAAYRLWFIVPPSSAGQGGDGADGAGQAAPRLVAAHLVPEADGGAAVTLDIPEAVTMPTGMAVTLEPGGGGDVPSDDVYLLGLP